MGRLLCNLFIAHLELERLLVDIRLHLTSLGLAIALECNHLLVLRRLERVQRRCVSLNLSLVSLLLTSQLQFVSAFLVHDLLGLVSHQLANVLVLCCELLVELAHRLL